MKLIKNKNARKPYTIRWWTEDRKQHEKSFSTEAEALAFSVTDTPDAASEPFASYAVRWNTQSAQRERKALATIRIWESLLRLHINPMLGDTRLKDITGPMLKNFFASIESPSIAFQSYKVIGAVLNSAVADKILAANPMGEGKNKIKVKQPETPIELVPFTREQLVTAIDAMPANIQALGWILYGTGARLGEGLALRETSFHQDKEGKTWVRLANRVNTGRTGVDDPEPIILQGLKSKDETAFRDVPVPPWLLEKVQAHLAEHGTVSGYLFPKYAVEGFGTATPLRIFKRGCKLAGLPKEMNFKQLRHHYCTRTANNGVPMSHVSKYMGHSTMEITYRRYSHLLTVDAGDDFAIMQRSYEQWN